MISWILCHFHHLHCCITCEIEGLTFYIAKSICKEAHTHYGDKFFYNIAFPNSIGGFETRNRYFQGTISPKDITYIKHNAEPLDSCYVFEGFIDYLSFLTLRKKHNPTSPNFNGQDYIVLNSVSNLSKALYLLGQYEHIHCFLDNDLAGIKAFQDICKNSIRTEVRDCSKLYAGYKDLNDFLCGKRSTELSHSRNNEVMNAVSHESTNQIIKDKNHERGKNLQQDYQPKPPRRRMKM